MKSQLYPILKKNSFENENDINTLHNRINDIFMKIKKVLR
jgi:hypothetical protein